jgi:DNA-binding CsgD family transcriptional regulator
MLAVSTGLGAVCSRSQLEQGVIMDHDTPPAEPSTVNVLDRPEPLSVRQVQILDAIAAGSSTKQTARQLGISTKTVHNHLNNIYRKLGTQTLAHTMVCAAKCGLIDLHITDLQSGAGRFPARERAPASATHSTPRTPPAVQTAGADDGGEA